MSLRPTNWSQLRSDIGGKWLGSTPAWLVIAPIWVVLSVALTPSRSVANIGLVFVANVVGVGAAFVGLWLCNRTIFRDAARKPVAVWIVVTVGAALAAFKAVVTNFSLGLLVGEPIDVAGLLARAGILAIFGAWLLPTVSIVLAVRERIELERDQLVRERVRLKFSLAAAGASTGSEPVDHALRAFIDSVEIDVAQSQSTSELADRIHLLVDEQLRPLSHELWQQESHRTPRLTFSNLAGIMYRNHKFATVPTLIGFVLLFLGAQVAFAGPTIGTARTLLQLGLISVVFEIAKRLPQTSTAVGAVMYFTVNLGLAIVLNVVSSAVFGPIPGYSAFASTLLLALYFFISSLLFGIIRAAVTERASIAAEIDALAEEQAIQKFEIDEARFRRNDLAQYLHSHVQNGMLTLALQLTRDTDQPVTDDQRMLIEALLADLGDLNVWHKPVDLDNELRDLDGRWSGLVNLTITNSIGAVAASQLDESTVRAIVQVANEAITNAVRHGDATSIRLTIAQMPDRVQLICEDDGLGQSDRNEPGLGSALFDSVAGADWRLISLDRGTRLELLIPTT